MKKILYTLSLSLTFIVLLSSCAKFNDQFEGLDDMTKLTNVVTYNYVLADADYSTISKSAVAIAANAGDSAKAKSIATNKYFTKTLPVNNYAPLLLNTKFKYADENSVTMLTYNLFAEYDTTTLSSANKYTLLTADYDAMGQASGQPGKFDNFDAGISPTFFVPIWLKINYPYAKSGDKKLVRYSFFINSTTTEQRTMVFAYDGTNWSKFATTTAVVAKFKFKSGAWIFIDSDILVGLQTGLGSNLGDFIPINVIGEQVWAWDASYKQMKMTGYVSGAYLDNEDWLVSPSMNFTERLNPVLKFDHVGRYFGDAGTANTKMKIAISVWVSTTSNGTSIVPSEWTKLVLPETSYPTGANWNFISSDAISLAAYKGQANVRIAFKYLSSAADGAAGTWEVKNAYVYEP